MKNALLGLMVWAQNVLASERSERGDINVGGGLGLLALVILILFIFWLTESAGKTNFFD